MRRVSKVLAILALFAGFATSCERSEEFDVIDKAQLTVVAEIGQVRSSFTALDGTAYPSQWNGGEKIRAALVKTSSDYLSEAQYTLSSGGTSAEMGFTFAEPMPKRADLYLCSPAESVYYDGSSNRFVVSVPTEQTPTATSVDPKAHILTAEISRISDYEADLSATFEHAASYGRMTLKNLALKEGAAIDYLLLQLDGTTYTLHADNVVDNIFWFGCSVNSTLSTMSLTVVDTLGRKYVKLMTGNIEFETGYVSVFTVNMDGIVGYLPNEVKPLAKADNIVMAHRGAYKEFSGTPHNSLASLRNAIALGCSGSELDIYWTKDNNVIVAHAVTEEAEVRYTINGLLPWESTVAQIQAAGKLSNGETVPTLQDYLAVAIAESKCTKLILDIKYIGTGSARAKYCIDACRRAIEIADSMGAKDYIEFICTSYSAVMEGCAPLCETAGIPIAWMSNSSASTYKSKGYSWANLSLEHMNDGILYGDNTSENGSRTVDEFVNKGIELSVYNADSDEQMNYYIARAANLKYICTNYPKKLLEKMGKR